MYATIHCETAKARIADMHQDAQRDALARAVRKDPRWARKNRSARPAPRLPLAAARRVLTVLGARA